MRLAGLRRFVAARRVPPRRAANFLLRQKVGQRGAFQTERTAPSACPGPGAAPRLSGSNRAGRKQRGTFHGRATPVRAVIAKTSAWRWIMACGGRSDGSNLLSGTTAEATAVVRGGCSSRTGEAQRPGLDKHAVSSAQFGRRFFGDFLVAGQESYPPAGAGPGGLHRIGEVHAGRTEQIAKDVRCKPDPAATPPSPAPSPSCPSPCHRSTPSAPWRQSCGPPPHRWKTR
jgi:hypothetical protein